MSECRCNCGYTCGGPGVCELDTLECIEAHYVKDCDHKWDGEGVEVGLGGWSVTCSVCGMPAMVHDCRCGP